MIDPIFHVDKYNKPYFLAILTFEFHDVKFVYHIT
jgi:hypothetical protein